MVHITYELRVCIPVNPPDMSSTLLISDPKLGIYNSFPDLTSPDGTPIMK